MRGRATAPASSANLGPGFDCIGLALEWRAEVECERSDRWIGDGSLGPFEPTPDNLVRRAAEAADPGPWSLKVVSTIPLARGLGSSAAVAAATYAAVCRAAGGEPADADVFAVVSRLEGHPDNAAAAVYGGLVAATAGRVVRLRIHPGLVPVVAVPDGRLPTRRAREALHPLVERTMAARTIARAVMLTHGLATADPLAFEAAAGDEFHEAPRAGLSPVTGALIAAARRAGALHAGWSGAGPTAFALTPADDAAAVEEAMRSVLAADTVGGEVHQIPIARIGLT